MNSKLTLAEQETIILWDNELDTASIYTHDPRLLRRLAELSAKYHFREKWCRKVQILPGPEEAHRHSHSLQRGAPEKTAGTGAAGKLPGTVFRKSRGCCRRGNIISG